MLATSTSRRWGQFRDQARAAIGPIGPPRAWTAWLSARAGWLAPALIALAAVALLWSRFIILTQGLWSDEVISVGHFVERGLIWDSKLWIPNDHMLFEALTWLTVRILGTHTEATYRLWSVFPAMAAWVVMTWWLWRRFDRWTAAVFAVLATVSPMFFDLGTQARGYGIGFLAGALMVIAADSLIRTQSRRALLLFGAAGLAGVLTLLDFTFAFLGVAGVLMLVPALRRQTALAGVCVGGIALVWYAPVLGRVIGHSAGVGSQLPWYAFATGAVRDQFGVAINMLVPGVSITAGAVIGGLVLLAGAATLWRAQERLLIALLLAPAIVTYILFDVGRHGFIPRFASYGLLPLIGLAAIAVVGVGRRLARDRGVHAVALTLLCAGMLLILRAFVVHVATPFAQMPREGGKEAGVIERGFTGPIFIYPFVGGSPFLYYAAPHRVTTRNVPELEGLFCTFSGQFMYIEDTRAPAVNTSCLTTRGGVRIQLSARLSRSWIWFVPAKAP